MENTDMAEAGGMDSETDAAAASESSATNKTNKKWYIVHTYSG